MDEVGKPNLALVPAGKEKFITEGGGESRPGPRRNLSTAQTWRQGASPPTRAAQKQRCSRPANLVVLEPVGVSSNSAVLTFPNAKLTLNDCTGRKRLAGNISTRSTFMKRIVASVAVAATAIFGLAACSSNQTTEERLNEPASAGAVEDAGGGTQSAANDATGQTVEEACASMAGPLDDISKALTNTDWTSGDPQATIDAWNGLGDAFSAASAPITNPEVKGAADQVHRDIETIKGLMQSIFVDGNVLATGDLIEATSLLQRSSTALFNLCKP